MNAMNVAEAIEEQLEDTLSCSLRRNSKAELAVLHAEDSDGNEFVIKITQININTDDEDEGHDDCVSLDMD